MHTRLLSILGTGLLVLIIGLLFYGALSGLPERVWLQAPGWSRAQVVGETRQAQAAPMAVDPAGGVYLLLAQSNGAEQQPQIVALDAQAQQRWVVALDGRYPEVREPQLIWADQALTLFWLSDAQLYTAQLAADGTIVRAPAAISGAVEVAGYSGAAPDIVWLAGAAPTPGLYLVRGTASGAGPTQLTAGGERPQVRYALDGSLHAIWLERTTGSRTAAVAYAPLAADGTLQAAPATLADGLNLGSDVEVSGPWFGIDATYGYVGWHTRITGGLRAGQTFTLHTAFPLGQPAEALPVQPLALPERSTTSYTRAATALNSGPQIMWDGTASGLAAAPAQMAANPTPAGELAVACEGARSVGSGQRLAQICVTYFAEGTPVGFQQISLSERSAFTPALIGDANGNLYLSWRELRATGAVVFFAATAPSVVEGLSAVSLDDMMRLASTVVFGMLAGVIFAPFVALLWMGPALALLIPYYLMQRYGVWGGRWSAAISIVLALAAFWAAKVAVLGPALSVVPFANWLPLVSSGLALTLQIVVPTLIVGGAAYGAWAASYGRGVRSPLLAVLVYGAIDTVATMAIYGTGLFGQ